MAFFIHIVLTLKMKSKSLVDGSLFFSSKNKAISCDLTASNVITENQKVICCSCHWCFKG